MPDSIWSTTLPLIHHAQARAADGSSTPDPPPSAVGRQQAASLAQSLATGPVSITIYTSLFYRGWTSPWLF